MRKLLGLVMVLIVVGVMLAVSTLTQAQPAFGSETAGKGLQLAAKVTATPRKSPTPAGTPTPEIVDLDPIHGTFVVTPDDENGVIRIHEVAGYDEIKALGDSSLQGKFRELERSGFLITERPTALVCFTGQGSVWQGLLFASDNNEDTAMVVQTSQGWVYNDNALPGETVPMLTWRKPFTGCVAVWVLTKEDEATISGNLIAKMSRTLPSTGTGSDAPAPKQPTEQNPNTRSL